MNQTKSLEQISPAIGLTDMAIVGLDNEKEHLKIWDALQPLVGKESETTLVILTEGLFGYFEAKIQAAVSVAASQSAVAARQSEVERFMNIAESFIPDADSSHFNDGIYNAIAARHEELNQARSFRERSMLSSPGTHSFDLKREAA
jgi:hypothetical protein